ncbi:MAG: hypothetical protein HPY57_15940 [Ignavibacteria bacterium]|nr:hypothetical protein [Ignavibacteria bacterium]
MNAKLEKLLSQINENMLINYGKIRSISMISEKGFDSKLLITDFDNNTKTYTEDELIKELETY